MIAEPKQFPKQHGQKKPTRAECQSAAEKAIADNRELAGMCHALMLKLRQVNGLAGKMVDAMGPIEHKLTDGPRKTLMVIQAETKQWEGYE